MWDVCGVVVWCGGVDVLGLDLVDFELHFVDLWVCGCHRLGVCIDV